MKSARAKLKKTLDGLWSVAIRALYGNKCVMCGRTENLAAHHCIIRKAQTDGVRWLKWNGVALCYNCHINKVHGQQADKEWLESYLRVLNNLIPKEQQDEVYKIGHRINKFSLDDLRDLIRTGWWNEKGNGPVA